MKTSFKLHIFLFLLTFLTLTFREGFFIIPILPNLKEIFFLELPYSITLIFILFCHEMGHYIPARIHGIPSTLPYFIPMPFGPIGTMGAVIKMKGQFQDKSKLFDVGVGGPFMSLILSVPAWIIGLYYSELVPILDISQNPNQILVFGDSLFTKWTSQWILGPYDPMQFDVMIHPLARAGWVGLIITAINLLPFGQLDGGHIIYSLFGESYRKWIYFLFIGFMFLSLVSFSWLIWAFLIYFLIKVEHPYVPDATEGISLSRKLLGGFMLLSFIFIFIPVPLTTMAEIHSPTLLDEMLKFILQKETL
ncbi:MAG: site-2 protease family protein [Leptospiraceae bacterium]|nr:site-2 protease family protein [Leptospiraceae bacterium]